MVGTTNSIGPQGVATGQIDSSAIAVPVGQGFDTKIPTLISQNIFTQANANKLVDKLISTPMRDWSTQQLARFLGFMNVENGIGFLNTAIGKSKARDGTRIGINLGPIDLGIDGLGGLMKTNRQQLRDIVEAMVLFSGFTHGKKTVSSNSNSATIEHDSGKYLTLRKTPLAIHIIETGKEITDYQRD